MPNHSFVKYVTEVFTPKVLALKMDERNRIQVNPKPNSQRTISSREYRNFGLGEGAAGSAASIGTANAVAITGASNAFIGFAAGRKNTPLPVRERIGVTFGTELAVKSAATFALSFFSAGAVSCACATHTHPSTSNAVAKILMVMLPSEGWPHAWEQPPCYGKQPRGPLSIFFRGERDKRENGAHHSSAVL